MTADLKSIPSPKSLRAMLAVQREFNNDEFTFCTKENLEESLSTIAEELESLDISSVILHNTELGSPNTIQDCLIKLVNASWKLIRKHRELMILEDRHSDAYARVTHENTSLKKQVKRLKEDMQKEQNTLVLTQERERRLKVQHDKVSRDLKHDKDEILKLRKQLLSKDNQHEHELRRIMQSGHKLREQLQKSIGTYVPKDKVMQNLQAEHEKEKQLYKQTIRRLEENNRLMLQEINDLKESLALHSTGINLHMEASGIWDDTEM